MTAENFEVAPNSPTFIGTSWITGSLSRWRDNPSYLPIKSPGVLAKIRAGTTGWEDTVSPEVAKIIKERQLFGYRPELVAKN